MNSNRKKMWKLITGIVAILAVPVLFFQLLGGSLLHMNGPGKRVIAVVNEDQGDWKDEQQIEMGREVVSILAEDSPYEWKVMGRGTATNGLKANQYEAVVYIPSDFSESIMSYEQQNPEKAEFSYQVQRQKTGSRKEQLLHEIEAATNRVNQRIATLYWSYVALEMDHIKNEFTNILEKETEFLDAMAEYYEPGSEALAELLKKQQEQMESIQATIGEAGTGHEGRIENAESFKQQLDGFVSYVAQYKAFQGEQKNILRQVQNSSLEKIQVAAATQMKQFNESVKALEESSSKLNSEIQKVNEVIDENKKKFETLSTVRKDEIDRQLADLLVVQGTAINRYNDSILGNLEKSITAGKNGASIAQNANDLFDDEKVKATKEQMDKKAAEKAAEKLPAMKEEKDEVDDIVNSIVVLRMQLEETDPDSTFLEELTALQTKLLAVASSIESKTARWHDERQLDVTDYSEAASDYGSLYEDYHSLYGDYQSARELLKSQPADTARLLFEIQEKETALLQHEALTAEKKKRLEELFEKGTNSTDTDALLAYYATLQQFEFTLDERGQGAHRDKLLKDEILTALLENVIEISEDELAGWDALGEQIPETELGMSNVSASFAAIVSGYKETVEEQHIAILTDLQAIDEQANVLLAQIETTENAGEPEPTTGEGEVMAGQQNVMSQLISLSGLMKSLSDRQDGLVDYTSDLHGKATDLKKTSNVFAAKWQENLEAMSAFKEDIQNFLGNTYVDGQENGYAFNHFVNPLSVKGEAAMTDEAKKVPPVILFIILLISTLLIGFFSHRFKEGSVGLRLGMLGMLALLAGLIISLYSVNMYVLLDQRAVEWTIFTVLLLLAGAAIVRVALDFGQTAGWVTSIVLMCLYILPLLMLAVPEIAVPDFLSAVYMSIKYEAETYFLLGIFITGIIAAAMMITTFLMNQKNLRETSNGEETYEG